MLTWVLVNTLSESRSKMNLTVMYMLYMCNTSGAKIQWMPGRPVSCKGASNHIELVSLSFETYKGFPDTPCLYRSIIPEESSLPWILLIRRLQGNEPEEKKSKWRGRRKKKGKCKKVNRGKGRRKRQTTMQKDNLRNDPLQHIAP